MGKLLSSPTLTLDCAQMGQIEVLLGPLAPYYKYEDGSPFNNFVTEHAGNRCVVFLDEFDKTEQKLKNALLKAMDTGQPVLATRAVYPRKLRLMYDRNVT